MPAAVRDRDRILIGECRHHQKSDLPSGDVPGLRRPAQVVARAPFGVGLLEVAVLRLPVLLRRLGDPAREPIPRTAHRDITELADDPDRRQNLQHVLVDADA